jgi:hypothetical protein
MKPIGAGEFPDAERNSLFARKNSLFLAKKFPVPHGSGNLGASH